MRIRLSQNAGLQLIGFLVLSQSVFSCTLSSALGFNNEGLPLKEVSHKAGLAVQNIIDHAAWEGLLKKHVHKDGLVDYKGLLNDRAELTSYLSMLSKNPPQEHWSTAELLAYYINTYNAYTVDLILENYPLQSIKQINGPWTKAIIPIGDKRLSLGGLENGILRKMNEPRIHFAINCASYSCPNLLNEAFTAQKMEQQLEKVSTAFINGNKNTISENEVALSAIFKWYKKDFIVDGEKNLIAFINKYSTIQIADSAKITYLDYDWNLNETP